METLPNDKVPVESPQHPPDPGSSGIKKRRNRRPKACLPCRSRKVACNYEEPCSTCRRRKHVHLCIYESAPARAKESEKTATTLTENIHSGYGQSPKQASATAVNVLPKPSSSSSLDGHDSAGIQDLPKLLDTLSENTTQLCHKIEQTGETLFLGRNSQASFFQSLISQGQQSQNNSQHQRLPADISVGSAFGLTNRTPLHPFGSLWSATARVTLGDILRSLPSSDRCMRYYRAYQQIAIPFTPYLLDSEDFERKICNVIQLVEHETNEELLERVATDLPYSDLAWYALLYAVLAAGCQLADEISSERVLTTRVFVACSFECLRLANFYVQPSLDTIQTTLIFEWVIANDSNPGAGWTFLAVSIRNAEGMGLHLPSSTQNDLHPIWKAVIHLDSMLASAFDRRPYSFLPRSHDVIKTLLSSKLEFLDLMHAVSCVRLEWQRQRVEELDEAMQLDQIRALHAKVSQVELLARSDGCSLESSRTMQAHLEKHLFNIHLLHLKGELHRAWCLNKYAKAEERIEHFGAMNRAFIEVIDAFVSLKPLTPFVYVSWDTLYCTLSAALLFAGIVDVRRTRMRTAGLRALVKSLRSIADSRTEDDRVSPNMTPFCHGLKALEALGYGDPD